MTLFIDICACVSLTETGLNGKIFLYWKTYLAGRIQSETNSELSLLKENPSN